MFIITRKSMAILWESLFERGKYTISSTRRLSLAWRGGTYLSGLAKMIQGWNLQANYQRGVDMDIREWTHWHKKPLWWCTETAVEERLAFRIVQLPNSTFATVVRAMEARHRPRDWALKQPFLTSVPQHIGVPWLVPRCAMRIWERVIY